MEQLTNAIKALTNVSSGHTTPFDDSVDLVKDNDIFQTGIRRFNPARISIFKYIRILGQHVQNSQPQASYETQKNIFLDRLGNTLSSRITSQVALPDIMNEDDDDGNEELWKQYFTDIRRVACLLFSTRTHREMKDELKTLKQGTSTLSEFYCIYEPMWKDYITYYNIANLPDTDDWDPQETNFWNDFIEACNEQERNFMEDEYQEGNFQKNWETMTAWLLKYQLKLDRFYTSYMKGLQKGTSETPPKGIQHNNLDTGRQQNNNSDLIKALNNMQQAQATSLKQLSDKTEILFNHLKTRDEGANDCIRRQSDMLDRMGDNSQYSNSNFQHRGRSRDTRGPYQQNRDRSRSPYGPRSYQQPRSRSNSRPRDPECYKCKTTGHWTIDCPWNKTMDTEREIYRKVKNAEKSGRITQSPAEYETELRTEHKCPTRPTVPNRTTIHDNNSTPPGTGRYCAWEHVKGHATDLCPNFCSICEKDGHYWGDCPTNPPFAQGRKAAWAEYLKEMDTPPYSNNP